MRAARKLPEEQDFRQWKQQLYEAYRAVEPKEHMWHLPDGRTLRVVTTPNPEGGVTYLYDDVTERLDMHRRYDALIKVQSETLDHLAEAVAVFGSDGRVRLHNPAFQRMWKLTPEALDQHPHVEAVTAWCQALHDDDAVWRNLARRGDRHRRPRADRRAHRAARRHDDRHGHHAAAGRRHAGHLPGRQRHRQCRARAARDATRRWRPPTSIKIEFVHHVSYELRSPLTNIIGFANLLGDPAFGPLTDKQREYLGYITTSTNALLALINNILDLATIDAGAMTLNLSRGRHPRQHGGGGRRRAGPAGQGRSHARHPRRARHRQLHRRRAAAAADPVQSVVQRGRLLAAGATVTLAAERRADAVVFTVTDHGPGIPPEAKDKVFDWFETDSMGSQHRGTGLGLSLVRSFVELHGGSVTIDSTLGAGHHGDLRFPDRAGRQADRGVIILRWQDVRRAWRCRRHDPRAARPD